MVTAWGRTLYFTLTKGHAGDEETRCWRRGNKSYWRRGNKVVAETKQCNII